MKDETWQPIETAPKNGTVILAAAWVIAKEQIGHLTVRQWGTWDVGIVRWRNGWIGVHDGSIAEFVWTHWYPIPQNPPPRP